MTSNLLTTILLSTKTGVTRGEEQPSQGATEKGEKLAFNGKYFATEILILDSIIKRLI